MSALGTFFGVYKLEQPNRCEQEGRLGQAHRINKHTCCVSVVLLASAFLHKPLKMSYGIILLYCCVASFTDHGEGMLRIGAEVYGSRTFKHCDDVIRLR